MTKREIIRELENSFFDEEEVVISDETRTEDIVDFRRLEDGTAAIIFGVPGEELEFNPGLRRL